MTVPKTWSILRHLSPAKNTCKALKKRILKIKVEQKNHRVTVKLHSKMTKRHFTTTFLNTHSHKCAVLKVKAPLFTVVCVRQSTVEV